MRKNRSKTIRNKKKRRPDYPFKSFFEQDFFTSVSKLVDVEYEGAQLDYVLKCIYKPDWKFYTNSNSLGHFYVETKGEFDASDRRKMLNVKRCNPLEDIRLVFMRDNFLYKGSKLKYSDWAEQNGFKYHIVGSTNKFVPTEWLKECTGGFTPATEELQASRGVTNKNGTRRTNTRKKAKVKD